MSIQQRQTIALAIVAVALTLTGIAIHRIWPPVESEAYLKLAACDWICTDRNEFNECVTYRRMP